MSITTLAIAAFAVYRLSVMLADAEQEGPFLLLYKLRFALGVRYNERSQAYGTTSISRGLLCTYCNSVWIGSFVAALLLLLPDLWPLLLPFALSGFTVLMEK